MIDIHSHILPQIDDGSVSWDESLEILRKGIEDGIRGVVCTSHILDRLDDNTDRKFTQKFKELEEIVGKEKLQINLWLGSEIHIHALDNRLSHKIATINGNGKYILIELPLGSIPNGVGEKFFQLSLKNFTPILAHPERNLAIIQRPELAYEFVQRGALTQLNAGSLTGDFGKRVKRTAVKMIDHQMVHFVASDCHSARSRSMILSKAYKFVTQHWGEDTADLLFQINPYKTIIGEEIIPPEPLPFNEKNSRVGRFFRFGNIGNL